MNAKSQTVNSLGATQEGLFICYRYEEKQASGDIIMRFGITDDAWTFYLSACQPNSRNLMSCANNLCNAPPISLPA